jgi:hypothetical protein
MAVMPVSSVARFLPPRRGAFVKQRPQRFGRFFGRAKGEVCPEGWAADGKTGDFPPRRGDEAAGMGDFAGETGRDGVCSGGILAAERENGPKSRLGTASADGL